MKDAWGLASTAVLFVLFAGCAGAVEAVAPSSSVPTSAASAAPTDEFGSISGTVLDEEQVPIGNLTVGLVELRRETQSDPVGAFTFNEVPEGNHTVVFQGLGFDTQVKRVSVKPGEVSPVRAVLKGLTKPTDWVWVEKFTQGVLTGNYVAVYPNDLQTWKHRYMLKDDPLVMQDMVFEVSWTPSTQLADGVRLYSGIDTWNSGRTLCNGTGHPVMRCPVPRANLAQDWGCDFAEDDKSCFAEWLFRPWGSTTTSEQVGAWPQESISVWTSHFFRMQMPPDYSGFPK